MSVCDWTLTLYRVDCETLCVNVTRLPQRRLDSGGLLSHSLTHCHIITVYSHISTVYVSRQLCVSDQRLCERSRNQRCDGRCAAVCVRDWIRASFDISSPRLPVIILPTASGTQLSLFLLHSIFVSLSNIWQVFQQKSRCGCGYTQTRKH